MTHTTTRARRGAALAALAAALGLAGTAHAQTGPAPAPAPPSIGSQTSGFYAGAGFDSIAFDSYAVSGRAGYDFNRYFSVEGQLGFGVSDEEYVFTTDFPFQNPDDPDEVITQRIAFQASAGLDTFVGAFAVGRLPIGERFELFGRAGYHFTGLGGIIGPAAQTVPGEDEEVESGFLGPFRVDASTDGIAYGGGVQINFGEYYLMGIRLEYTRFDTGSTDTVEFGEVDRDLDDPFVENLRLADPENVVSLSFVQRF